MAGSVVAALRETKKGQLSPGTSWEACSAAEKIAILDALTRAPPISPEAAIHRIVQECPISPTIADYQEEEEEEEEEMVTTTQQLLNYSTPDTSFVSDHSLSVVREQRQELEDYERITDDQIMNEVELSMRLRRQLFSSELEGIRSCCMEKHVQVQEELEREREREKAEEKMLEEANKANISEQLRLVHEQYRAHLMILADQRCNNELRMLQQLQQIEERKKQEMLQVFEWCKHLKQEANSMSHRFAILFRACRYPEMLNDTSAIQYISQAEEQIRQVSKSLIILESAEDPTMAQVTQIKATLTGVQPLLAEVKKCIEEVDEKGDQMKREEEEKEKQKRQEEEKRNIEKLKQSQDNAKTSTTVVPQSQPEGEIEGSSGKEEKRQKGKKSGILASSSTLKWYQSLQDKLTLAMDTCASLTKTTDRQVQKYRFNLQKAVNIPVCAISSQSGSHLLDKIRRLESLLSGSSVEVTGKTISIRTHPHAKLYCTNFMAMKLVKQGEEQAGSRPETVFPIASVVVQIWSSLPEFGELFIAHCHSSCPVLAPIYFTPYEGISEGDLYRLQGYQVSQDGTVESDDLFLKRMSGIVRLYAAVLVTSPREHGKAHPHGLEHGWTWLACVLNTEPQLTITATALYDFLEVAGYALMKQFGRQFKKLLFLLVKQFLPKIEKITPLEERGPLSRLKQFLEDCVSNGDIRQPAGILTDSFWRSRGEGIVSA